MVYLFRNRWVFGLLAVVGAVSSAVAQTPSAYKPDQHIMIKLGDKPERRCVVVSVKAQPDGLVEYQLKAIDNGETLTVFDRPGTVLAKPLPTVDPNAPKPQSSQSDPLLASSIRRPSTGFERPTSAQLAASPFLTQPRTTAPSATEPLPSGIKKTVVVYREPRTKQELVAQQPVELPPSTIASQPKPTPDPVPVQQARTPLVNTTMSDPVSMGFVIPVSNASTTPKTKQYEREDRIVMLGERLRNELKPSARELAAEALAEGAGADSAAVRSQLLTAAANDPAATVRATCVRCLVKIGVRDQALAALILTAKQDPDARVRIEIDRAEELLK
jgi:hypothetical protein